MLEDIGSLEVIVTDKIPVKATIALLLCFRWRWCCRAPICWDLTTEDFVNTLFPFFHTGGLTVALLCNLWSGCSIGITSTAFNFEEYLKSIEKYKVQEKSTLYIIDVYDNIQTHVWYHNIQTHAWWWLSNKRSTPCCLHHTYVGLITWVKPMLTKIQYGISCLFENVSILASSH